MFHLLMACMCVHAWFVWCFSKILHGCVGVSYVFFCVIDVLACMSYEVMFACLACASLHVLWLCLGMCRSYTFSVGAGLGERFPGRIPHRVARQLFT